MSEGPPFDHPTKRYAAEEFLDAVAELDSPVAGEIAKRVGCTQRTARYRLRKLEDEGRVEGLKAGEATVWTLAESEPER